MSLCAECSKWKDNGEPYCDACDPKGTRNSEASDPMVREKLAKDKRAAELRAELAKLEGDSN